MCIRDRGDPAALNYFIAEKYVKAIDAVAHSNNQKVFLMPMDMAGLAGTLGGISEIARNAMGASAHPEASQKPRSPFGGGTQG